MLFHVGSPSCAKLTLPAARTSRTEESLRESFIGETRAPLACKIADELKMQSSVISARGKAIAGQR